jgi:hypothetical protein
MNCQCTSARYGSDPVEASEGAGGKVTFREMLASWTRRLLCEHHVEMASRLTLKTVNDELTRRGHTALLVKGDGYFYFRTGETANWLDRTVRVRTINSLTLKQWVEEFRRLKDLNERIMRTAKGGRRGESSV